MNRQSVYSCLVMCRFFSSKSHRPFLLQEIGQLEQPRLSEPYERGQTFIHRVFDYRGITLFPWVTKVHDKDLAKHAENDQNSSPEQKNAKLNTYYQVLIDSRDENYLENRLHLDAVTYLANTSASNLCSVHALDHVAHEDIVPYRTSEKPPIHHELFSHFFEYDAQSVPPSSRGKLVEWQEKHRGWLESSAVYKETTDGIKITVIPFYLGKDTNRDQYWWRYCVRMENLSNRAVQLRERNWRVFSISGTFETTRGNGVIGRNPMLTKQEPVFQYGSHINLQSPSGHMWGTFIMEAEDGSCFETRIPSFTLESREDKTGPIISPSPNAPNH